MTWFDLLLSYAWFMARVIGLSLLIIGVIVWLNWKRLGKPLPPDDFK